MPDDAPNITMTGETIGNLTTHLDIKRFGTLVVPDKDDRVAQVIGEHLVIRQGNLSWQYTIYELERELSAKWRGTALFVK